jgi:DNA helicase-2/ATP-dependent DNA helicase PcrA
MLTDEQKEAVRCPADMMLTACPGSGKTRVIISKLSRVLDEIRGTPRSVACITYTNTGVYEIEARLRHHTQPGDESCYEIGTIHSFCLNHIFRPFCHHFDGYQDGFKVLTQDSEEFEKIVAAVCAQGGRYNLTYKDFEEFTQLRVGIDGEPVGAAIEHGALTVEVAKAFWKKIREAGFIDFANIIYYSFILLRERSEVLSYVSSRFAWILVDEFQDTSDLQVEILTLIAAQGRTRFLLVGDPCQSIFGFAGARPDLADEFAGRIGARTDLTLSGNFRSSMPIINHANLLFLRTPRMTAVGDAKVYTEKPLWQHGSTPFQVIRDYFLPMLDEMNIPVGDAAILAPAWFSLFPLGRSLREYGVSIVGPGARPYKRSRQFSHLAEQVCGYLMEPRPDLIVGVERALFNTVLDVTGRANFDLFSYTGRLIVFRLLETARELHKLHAGAIGWLEAAAKAFTKILVDEGLFGPSDQTKFPMSVEEMKADMRNNKVDLPNLTIPELGIYASPDAALKLATLHYSKGREFEAVAMINLHEGSIPFYQASTQEEFDEAKRLFYVGVTRAKRLLMYITDKSHTRNQPTRFLRAGTGVGVC